MGSVAKVSIHIVTYNSGDVIAPCLDALFEAIDDCSRAHPQAYSFSVLIADNASSDATVSFLTTTHAGHITLVPYKNNTGFCYAHNALVERALSQDAEYVLVLNPDVAVRKGCLSHLVDALASDPRAGMACPKLLRADNQLVAVHPTVIDAAGM